MDTNGNGTLTNATVTVVPGYGRIFVDISPLFTIDTQQSATTAIQVAARKAGVNLSNYDVLLQIMANAQVVDGPSGGAALTTLAYSAFTGQKIRTDMTMTGTINADGSIGQVGGVFQKAQAAAQEGIKLFLIPAGQSDDSGVDLPSYAAANWGMQVVEVGTMSDVFAIAFTPAGSMINVTPPSQPPLPNFTQLALSPSEELFVPLVNGTIQQATQELNSLNSTGVQGLNFHQFASTLNQSQVLWSDGYLYSAANEAFLVQTQLDAISYSNYSAGQLQAMDLQLLKTAQDQQFAPLQQPSLEWEASAQLRHFWALSNLQLVMQDLSGQSPDLAADDSDLASAANWLWASGQLDAIARQVSESSPSSPVIDDNSLKGYAYNGIQEAQQAYNESDNPDSEAQEHLTWANLEYSSGAYLAASVDASIALATQNATDQFSQDYADDAAIQAQQMAASVSPSDYAWTQMYNAHALYYYQYYNATQDSTYALDALKLAYMAQDWSQALDGVQPWIANPQPVGSGQYPNVIGNPAPIQTTTNNGMTVVAIPSNSTLQITTGLAVAGVAVILLSVLLGALIATLFSSRGSRGQSPSGSTDPQDKLDDALIDGRISESTYYHLRERRFGQPAQSPVSEVKEAPAAASEKPKRRAAGRRRS
jgi:uncharacterized protein